MKQLKVGKSDFVRETKGKFGDYYKIGKSLGLGIFLLLNFDLMTFPCLGSFGEVRKCESKLTGNVRAVKILNKTTLKEKDVKRFHYEIELLR